jgi:hypothetical protein
MAARAINYRRIDHGRSDCRRRAIGLTSPEPGAYRRGDGSLRGLNGNAVKALLSIEGGPKPQLPPQL